MDYGTLVSTVVGVIIGGVVATLGGFCEKWWERKLERASMASALASELRALKQRYEETIGLAIRKAKNPTDLPSGLYPGQQYFAVFDSAGSSLGLLDADDASLVVETYILAKGHLDNLDNWDKGPPRESHHLDRLQADDKKLTKMVGQCQKALTQGR